MSIADSGHREVPQEKRPKDHRKWLRVLSQKAEPEATRRVNQGTNLTAGAGHLSTLLNYKIQMDFIIASASGCAVLVILPISV